MENQTNEQVGLHMADEDFKAFEGVFAQESEQMVCLAVSEADNNNVVA